MGNHWIRVSSAPGVSPLPVTSQLCKSSQIYIRKTYETRSLSRNRHRMMRSMSRLRRLHKHTRRFWIRIRNTGIAQSHLLSSPKSRINHRRRHDRTRTNALEINHARHKRRHGAIRIRGADDILSRDGDAVWRAGGTDNASALPTVMLPIPEGEGHLAYRTVCYLVIGLPSRSYIFHVIVSFEGRPLSSLRLRR